MISDKAVEAAHQAHLTHKSVRSPDNAKNAMRAALEAAAPHIAAAAWDEGYAAGRSDGFAADKGFTGYHTNPYRSQA